MTENNQLISKNMENTLALLLRKLINQELQKNDYSDFLNQKQCAAFFNISVNTLKCWVSLGCPEIRLETGSVYYTKKAIYEWLTQHQRSLTRIH
ncbi:MULTISPECIES: DNA-binding protein [Lapidilactobacillus]|jgi:hypothetical protein|uniref:DNA-binding protein n=1 Tax=Lapidilactobacillus gannanensis TaxID=2486002 RepID=A0ABW4BM35_9LACO|nr:MULTISPECIES: DNA-binding protein [Lapidilactobacillus]MCH4056800.1 DNA-binding protein [Lactobacillaceae bacterium]